MGRLKELGADLVVITPQLPQYSLEMADKHRFSFDLLSDPGNGVGAAFGLRFSLSDDLREVYRGFGIDLPSYNGDETWTLSIPGRFVSDSGGIIRAAEADPDYTVRTEPDVTVEQVASLVKAGT